MGGSVGAVARTALRVQLSSSETWGAVSSGDRIAQIVEKANSGWRSVRADHEDPSGLVDEVAFDAFGVLRLYECDIVAAEAAGE